MLEQQLGRRNLSDAERYEIVQKFKSIFQKKAKENQSLGGKGLPNLVKVNVQEEMARFVGVSKGTYSKLDKVMQSNNEEVKQQLREKKISIDKAYQEIKNPKPKEKESITPEQKIIEFDNRMNEIDKEISSLSSERESLMRRRRSLFESLDIPCELKYEFIESVSPIDSRDCRFYIEIDGYKQIFVECAYFPKLLLLFIQAKFLKNIRMIFLCCGRRRILKKKSILIEHLQNGMRRMGKIMKLN